MAPPGNQAANGENKCQPVASEETGLLDSNIKPTGTATRVHRFTAEGTLIQSWGEPATEPGQFHLPHGIGISPDDRIFVADREAPGNFVAPHTLCVDSRGDLYVGEVTWTFGVSRSAASEDAHTFQKFTRA